MKMPITLTAVFITVTVLTACGSSSDNPATGEPVPLPVPDTVTQTTHMPEDSDDIKVESNISEKAEDGEDFSEAEVVTDEASAEEADTGGELKGENRSEDAAAIGAQSIVWLGDSLAQGSLGDYNDNLDNAPYVKLQKLVSVPVEGYAIWGGNTHDILRAYTSDHEYNQKIDPKKTYIFWLGSNDWCPAYEEPNADTTPVMAQIDEFLSQNGGVSQYIVLGTSSRVKIKDLYIPINRDLSAHYGVHYMDVMDIINKYGYSPDKTHLTQAAYDAVAEAVYTKLKSLGYI